jgi:hypothetical protein
MLNWIKEQLEKTRKYDQKWWGNLTKDLKEWMLVIR